MGRRWDRPWHLPRSRSRDRPWHLPRDYEKLHKADAGAHRVGKFSIKVYLNVKQPQARNLMRLTVPTKFADPQSPPLLFASLFQRSSPKGVRRLTIATANRMAWGSEKCDEHSTTGLVRPATDYAGEAIQAVKTGKVIFVPTDTLYGFACDACSMEAVHRIYEIKGRKHTSPLAICVGDVQDIQLVVRRGDSSILEKSLNPGLDSIGVRSVSLFHVHHIENFEQKKPRDKKENWGWQRYAGNVLGSGEICGGDGAAEKLMVVAIRAEEGQRCDIEQTKKRRIPSLPSGLTDRRERRWGWAVARGRTRRRNLANPNRKGSVMAASPLSEAALRTEKKTAKWGDDDCKIWRIKNVEKNYRRRKTAIEIGKTVDYERGGEKRET
ncbi:yrdC domain-containing protein, mitochondrial-like [Salvia divinorum]|uniref:Threonylcarbamoyl-AMP synthase n=1 Tax=Salvia divinorum TaxID=28513 RepID=A0ABD1IHD6_SALDI